MDSKKRLFKPKKEVPQFDEEYLTQLVHDDSSCVTLQNTKQHIALHPQQFGALRNAVKDLLNQSITKYDKQLDGLLLGYRNVKVITHLGELNDDSCFVHLDIEADFYVFRPKIGRKLNGVVKKKSTDNVGCLVHKIFNVALPRPDDEENWLGHSVHLNNEVLFKVTYLNLDSGLPYIRGEILSILPDSDSGVSTGNETVPAKVKIRKTKKKSDQSTLEDESVNGSPKKRTSTPKRVKKTESLGETSLNKTVPAKIKRSKSTVKDMRETLLKQELMNLSDSSLITTKKRKNESASDEDANISNVKPLIKKRRNSVSVKELRNSLLENELKSVIKTEKNEIESDFELMDRPKTPKKLSTSKSAIKQSQNDRSKNIKKQKSNDSLDELRNSIIEKEVSSLVKEKAKKKSKVKSENLDMSDDDSDIDLKNTSLLDKSDLPDISPDSELEELFAGIDTSIKKKKKKKIKEESYDY